jgi:hypothetical protein
MSRQQRLLKRRPTVGSYQHRLVVIAVVHAQVGQLVQQVAGLDRGGDIDDLVVSAHPWGVGRVAVS